ncbi:hypothetical protein G5I_01725 [Acromyrmex echinatior]|uniref:Uncharacterized protein n=1 Tax=Acromyrmex echinatior TaxID=103372 RepID=F4W8E4_ACREC|nr:hypothetical protein G5I_01725 [Acromyrmex echinatior]
MFDAISGDTIRLKSQAVEAIPSVLPAKWLVTRVPMFAHKAQCNTRGGFIRAWVISEEEKEEEEEEEEEKEKKEIDFAAPRTMTSRIANMEYNTRRVKYVPEAFVNTGICMIMTCGNVTLKLQVHRNNSLFHHRVLRKQYLPRMEVTTLRAHGIPDVTPRCIPGIPAVVYVDMCIDHRLNSSNVLGNEELPGG